MKLKFRAAFGLLLLMFVASAIPCMAAEKPVGYIQTADGTVEVMCKDGEVQAGAFDLPILPEDVISTGTGSTAQIMFIDKTILAMDENSKVSVFDVYTPKKGGMFDMNFMSGTARIITSEILSENPEKFRALTPLGTIGIRGTELGLLAETDREVVMLYEGGPAIYTDGQFAGLSDAEHSEMCATLADSFKKVKKAYDELKHSMNVSGKRKTKKQLAQVKEYQQEYHCAP